MGKKLNPDIKLDDQQEPEKDKWTPEDVSFYFDKALPLLNQENYTTAQEYVDLLINQCLAEKHWSDAFTYFLTKVKEMGLEIETDQEAYRAIVGKIMHWRMVRQMINSAGLMRYEDEILKYEIAKFYPNMQPMGTLPPSRTREVPIDRPRPKRNKPAPKK